MLGFMFTSKTANLSSFSLSESGFDEEEEKEERWWRRTSILIGAVRRRRDAIRSQERSICA